VYTISLLQFLEAVLHALKVKVALLLSGKFGAVHINVTTVGVLVTQPSSLLPVVL
jgi:hypothetical protein